MKITLYTTSLSSWYRKRLSRIEEAYAPHFPITFDLVRIKPPKDPVLKVDKDGDIVLDWDWFTLAFPQVDKGGVGFHFNRTYSKRWKITLGGQRNSDREDVPYFWFTSDREKARGYDDLSRFEQLVYHEIGHHWEDLDNDSGDALKQGSVHYCDYDLKQIHNYHRLVDFSKLSMETIKPFFQRPYPVTQAFGVKNPIYTRTGHHIGTDFATPSGTVVDAPLSGKLTRSVGTETGIVATLETAQGTFQFLHLSHCAPNGNYKQGAPIAVTGNSGTMTTGPHCCVRWWITKPDVSKLTKTNFRQHLKSVV